MDLRCQELGIVLASDLALKVLLGEMELVALRGLLAQLLSLLMEQLERIVLGDVLALGGLDVVPCPLPELTSRHLGGSGILHEVVDGHAANAADPGLHVAQTNVEVLADAIFSDLAGYIHVEQVVGGNVNVLAADKHLVGRRHVGVEDIRRNGSERRMSHPSAIVTGAHLSELVSADLCHGGIVRLLVILDGNLCGHSTHGVYTSLVTGLDEKLDVCVHERASHGDRVTVGENEVGVLAEALDGAEDVVPATAVETSRVVTELVDNLYIISLQSCQRCRLSIPHPSRKQL